jgi:glycogen(starch) synthase
VKVLIYSPAYLPHIGGLEISQAQLAESLVELGHRVTVVTKTPSPDGTDESTSYRVRRQPSARTLLREVKDCDVFFHANVSLRGLWPLLLTRPLWAVSHHSWYRAADGLLTWQDRLKRRALRHADLSVAVSHAVAADLDTESVVIPNAYRDDLFRVLPGARRDRDLIFVGRLVSDKGVDLLLRALHQLSATGLPARLTVVGEGPELSRLQALAAELSLGNQLEFVGTVRGHDLVELLNQHRILVAPSRYNEPFGIVALEGIACGCVVVGSAGGGLPEAIGPCGLTFRNGDVDQLTHALRELLSANSLESYTAKGDTHLSSHRREVVGRQYHEALLTAARRARARRKQ